MFEKFRFDEERFHGQKSFGFLRVFAFVLICSVESHCGMSLTANWNAAGKSIASELFIGLFDLIAASFIGDR